MGGMADFFAELKRRQIYRVGAAYVVAAWVLTQVIEILAEVFTLPLWIAQTAIVLLAIGFPVALFVTWTIESKPHQAVAAAVRSKPTILDWTLLAALAVVMVLIGYQQLAPTRQAGVDAQKEQAASTANAISLAVLPFANLSSDPEQEFFSDGITEEITAALARVPDLRVVGRTSAFQFKGQNLDLRAIGQSLSATHLIEGSVRKVGDRVRITVQLILANDGTHVWLENYDRQLTDVFAIQEDIARTVTASLNIALGLRPGENLVNNRGIDTESYEKYLRATALIRARGGTSAPAPDVRNMTDAALLLEDVLTRNPGYAPAWGRLGGAYAVLANRYSDGQNVAEARTLAAEFRAKGEAAAQRAIQLDPNFANSYALLGWFMRSRARLIEAEALLDKALALEPLDPDVLFLSGMFSNGVGRLSKALELAEKGYEVERFFPNLAQNTVHDRWLTGQNDAAITLARTLRPDARATVLALIYASMNRFGEAADALTELSGGDPNSNAAKAARLLRAGPAKGGAEDLPELRDFLGMLYLYIGAPERALEPYERMTEVEFVAGNFVAFIWHPAYAPVRKTERFKKLVRDLGLVTYCRERGWPEFCKPVGADDFACA